MTEDKSLQNIIEEYFRKNNLLKNQGIFLEAGAYDGIEQSNTFFLENAGWKGVLVEPSFENYLKCISNRSLSTSVNCALVSPSDYNKSSFVFGDFDSDIMSSISATRRSALRKQKYKRTTSFYKLPLTYLIDYFRQKNNPNNSIPVTGITISMLLNRLNISNLDFLSLDIEGYEYEALLGIDFEQHKPKLILVEIYNHQLNDIQTLLIDNGYNPPENMTNYSLDKNPNWDGTHNDYLFTLDLNK